MCFFFMPRRRIRALLAWLVQEVRQAVGKVTEKRGKNKTNCLFFIPSGVCSPSYKVTKVHYYNMKHSFFSLFFILFKGTSKKTAKKFARFQKTFYLCTRIQNKCIIASVAQLVRAPDC